VCYNGCERKGVVAEQKLPVVAVVRLDSASVALRAP